MTALLLATLLVPDATPARTVQAFVDAVRAGDASAAARRVVEGKPLGFPLVSGYLKLKAVLGEERIDGDTATVEADATSEPSDSSVRAVHPPRTVHETVRLRRIDGDWRIVPEPRSDFERVGPLPGTLIARWATLVTDGELLRHAREIALRTQGLIASKDIALAAILYASDHGDRLPQAGRFRLAVAPYLKKLLGPHPTVPDPFVAPGAPQGTTFFMDPRLSGRSLSSLGPVSEIALIVMGKAGRATFPYDGKAVLSYADGHARRVEPEAVYHARTVPLG